MKFKGRNQIRPEFNMSSMTDVVFLLLIFFMIASTLAKQLNTIDVKLPKADGKTENRNTIAVTITNSNQFYLNPFQTGNYTVSYLDSNGCFSISDPVLYQLLAVNESKSEKKPKDDDATATITLPPTVSEDHTSKTDADDMQSLTFKFRYV